MKTPCMCCEASMCCLMVGKIVQILSREDIGDNGKLSRIRKALK